jgi:hypothetical protein
MVLKLASYKQFIKLKAMKYRSLSLFFTPVFATLILSACASGRSGTPASVAQAPKSVPASGSTLVAGGNVANGASLEATQDAQFPMTPEEKKKLLIDLKKIFATEEKSLQHDDKTAMKELSATQTAKQKTWHDQEKQARKAFFEQHQNAAERRPYVLDYIKRKTEFDQAQKDELAAAKKASKEKADHLKENQKLRELQFKAQLDQNKHPDTSLWKAN